MVGLFANIGQSFGYSARNTFLRPLFWLGLIIIAIIAGLCMVGSGFFLGMGMWYLSVILWIITAILALFCLGLVVKIFANKPLTFKGFFGSVGRGFQFFVITLIYSIIVGIVGAICAALGVFGPSQQSINALMTQIQTGNFDPSSLTDITTTLFPDGVTAVGVIMLIVYILVCLFFAILMIAAVVNFARAGKFGAAFHFGEIFRRIGVLGVFKFILAIIIYVIITVILSLLFSFISGLLLLIPVPILNVILAIIFVALVGPFLGVFAVKYFSNLFA